MGSTLKKSVTKVDADAKKTASSQHGTHKQSGTGVFRNANLVTVRHILSRKDHFADNGACQPIEMIGLDEFNKQLDRATTATSHAIFN